MSARQKVNLLETYLFDTLKFGLYFMRRSIYHSKPEYLVHTLNSYVACDVYVKEQVCFYKEKQGQLLLSSVSM
jgi:hypothetical protein